MADRPYSRVYWSVMDDAKFDGIREDVRHFGTWTLLLIVADMAYPAPAFVPATVPKASVNALASCGLVDLLSGGRYRVHGLASERGMRSESGRNAAAVRWQGARNADPMLDETSIDEHRKDETSTARASANGRARRPSVVDQNPVIRAVRDVDLARIAGENGTVKPPSQRRAQAIDAEREANRLEALALHGQFTRGEISETEYERRRQDIGKEPDDLTRWEFEKAVRS